VSHRLPAFGLAALSVVALVTGCAPQAEPTPTPTPRFTSQAQAYQAAEATYRAYVDALNRVDLSDPATFEDVYKWETGEALNSDKKNLTRYHAEGITKTGTTVLKSIQSRSASVDDTAIQLNICEDVSSVDLRDATGKSIVSSDRADIQATRASLQTTDATSTGYQLSGVWGRSDGPSC
jgi:hypothetical protein